MFERKCYQIIKRQQTEQHKVRAMFYLGNLFICVYVELYNQKKEYVN